MDAPSANLTLAFSPRGERGALHAPRQQAIQAMQLAARSLAIEPANLTVADYRRFRSAQGEADLPVPRAISLVFAGWQRACEHLAAAMCDGDEVEADVIRALYGDPYLRHRAYDTRESVCAGP